jgi:hypothetical protein
MKISIAEVKRAMADPKFRQALPPILKEDVQKYEQNPGCTCNLSVYRNVLKHGVEQIKAYFPGQPIVDPDKELAKLAENDWTVFSCHMDDLEKMLKTLPPGRKQLAVARWQDQVTVIVNNLDVVF